MRMTALTRKVQQVLCILLPFALQLCSAQTEEGGLTHTRAHVRKHTQCIYRHLRVGTSDKSLLTPGLERFTALWYMETPVLPYTLNNRTCSAHVRLVCHESPTPLPRLRWDLSVFISIVSRFCDRGAQPFTACWLETTVSPKEIFLLQWKTWTSHVGFCCLTIKSVVGKY